MSGSDNTKEQRRSQEPHSADEQGGGHTGEGAASVMAHLISQARQQRPPGEAEDAAGSQRS